MNNPEIVSLIDIACACMQMELYYIITLSTLFFFTLLLGTGFLPTLLLLSKLCDFTNNYTSNM